MRIEKGKRYLFAHRGYSSKAVENTLDSFSLAKQEGIPGVELDVHLTRDNRLVVAHDFSLKRTSGVDKTIEEMEFAALEAYDVGAYKGMPGRIPLLSEVFASMGKGLFYDIELKDNGIRDIGLEKELWKTIKEYGMEPYCVVSSFNPLAIHRFRIISKGQIDVAIIYSNDPSVPRPFRHGAGRFLVHCDFLKPERKLVDEKLMRHLSSRYPIITWTVDDKKEALRLEKLGVTGVISNDPSACLQVFG